jgi:hypothetical protein
MKDRKVMFIGAFIDSCLCCWNIRCLLLLCNNTKVAQSSLLVLAPSVHHPKDLFTTLICFSSSSCKQYVVDINFYFQVLYKRVVVSGSS